MSTTSLRVDYGPRLWMQRMLVYWLTQWENRSTNLMDRYYIYLCRPRDLYHQCGIDSSIFIHRFRVSDAQRELFRLISVVSVSLSTGKCLLFRMHRWMIDIQIGKSSERESRQTLLFSRFAFARNCSAISNSSPETVSERSCVKGLPTREKEKKREKEKRLL